MTRSLLLSVLLAAAAAAQDGVAVLRANCLPCHSEKNRTSGLSLETRESSFRGGNRGPAITADNPESSTLMQAIRQNGDLKMPPGRKLKDEEIAAIQKWVASGPSIPQ